LIVLFKYRQIRTIAKLPFFSFPMQINSYAYKIVDILIVLVLCVQKPKYIQITFQSIYLYDTNVHLCKVHIEILLP